MTTKLFLSLMVTASLLTVSNIAGAGIGEGKISVYHLNADVPNRGVCVQMNPALSTGWACLYLNSSLYKEITATLLAGYVAGRTCKVFWNTTGTDGYASISSAECL